MADPLWINKDPVTGQPELSARELRQAMALALQYDGRPLGARQGVRPGGTQLQVSLAGSVITVQPGVCCIDPGLTAAQGPYWVAIPAAETPGPLAAADATNARKDIIVGRVYDHDEDGAGLRLARTEYIAGVAGAAPDRPVTPPGAFRLATIDVPKAGGGAPVVTNEFPFTVAAGGLLPVRNKAERDLITPYDGFAIYRQDRDWVEICDGTGAWRVQGTPIVTSVADLAAITHPHDGLIASNVGDGMLYRYNAALTPQWRVVEYNATQTLTASQPRVTFSNIPTYLKDIEITWSARGDAAAVAQWLYMKINDDGVANYRWGYQQAAPAGVTPVQTMPDTRMVAGMLSGGNAFTGIFGSGVIKIQGWESPHNGNLGMTHEAQILQDGSNFFMVSGGGHYSPPGPYTRIDLLPGSGGNFVTGTRVTVRGSW